jgi:hypothetical protein
MGFCVLTPNDIKISIKKGTHNFHRILSREPIHERIRPVTKDKEKSNMSSHRYSAFGNILQRRP